MIKFVLLSVQRFDDSIFLHISLTRFDQYKFCSSLDMSFRRLVGSSNFFLVFSTDEVLVISLCAVNNLLLLCFSGALSILLVLLSRLVHRLLLELCRF